MKRSSLVAYSFCILGLGSCVSKKKYDALNNENSGLKRDNSLLLDRIDSLGYQNIGLRNQLAEKTKNIARLVNDSIDCATLSNSQKKTIKDQDTRIKELNKLQEDLIEVSKSESSSLNTKLKQLESQLASKAKNLNEREDESKKLAAELETTKRNLEAREKKVNELQAILQRKDSIVNALQSTVSKALNSFTGSGLNITKKNGKIYVSLSEQLLFATGSRNVEVKGKQALKELAKVLEINPDINIAVEGHTDDVGEVYYNWDLSVERATSIVRILTEGTKIDPTRIVASGRGKFMPVDPSKTNEARQKNRRTEIILTPKLDDLFQIIESN
jgi:chemotaxis protein MotB